MAVLPLKQIIYAAKLHQITSWYKMLFSSETGESLRLNFTEQEVPQGILKQ